MEIGDRIRKSREDKKISARELARRTHLSPSFISDIELNKTKPSMDSLELISQALDVKKSYLLGEEASPLNNPTRPPDNTDMPHGEPPVWIDVVEPVVCAGNGNGYVEVDWEPVDRYPFSAADLIGYAWHSGKMRIIQIEGNSMEPRYRDGDRIMFSEEEVASGDVAIVLWDGKLLIRGYVLERDNTVHLRALNRENPEIIVYPDDERFQVLGKVLGRVSRFEPDKGFW